MEEEISNLLVDRELTKRKLDTWMKENDAWFPKRPKVGAYPEEYTPIHEVIDACVGVEDMMILERFIKAIPWALEKFACRDKSSYGGLPIHLATRKTCSHEIIRLIAEAYPEGLSRRDSNRKLPIEIVFDQLKDRFLNPRWSKSASVLVSLTPKCFLRGGQLLFDLLEYDGKRGPLDSVAEKLIERVPQCLYVRRGQSNFNPLEWALSQGPRLLCRGELLANDSVCSVLIRKADRKVLFREGQTRRIGRWRALGLAFDECFPESVVRALADKHPQCLSEMLSVEKQFPLREAVILGFTADLVGAWASRFPGAVSATDSNGQNTMHHARSASIMRALMAYDSNACRVADTKGRLFLHEAARHARFDPEMIDLCPEACLHQDMDGKLPLHHTLEGFSDDRKRVSFAVKLLMVHPEAAQVQDSEKRLPLHVLASSDMPSETVVSRLLEAYPAACCLADTKGRLPAHLACLGPRGFDELRALIVCCPVSTSAVDCDGATPLHLLADKLRSYHVSLRNVKVLLEACPSACLVRDNEGSLPLHRALHGLRRKKVAHSVVESVSAILDACPESAKEANATGDLPLHCCLRCRCITRELVCKLVDAYPEACFVLNDDGMLPLHVGLSCRIDPEVLESMLVMDGTRQVKMYPRKTYTSLWPCRGKYPLLRIIVGAFPSILSVHSFKEEGHRFLHELIMCPLSTDCLRFLLSVGSDFLHLTTGSNGDTILHVACRSEHMEAGHIMLICEADKTLISQANDDGLYPLHILCNRNIERLGNTNLRASLINASFRCELLTMSRNDETLLHTLLPGIRPRLKEATRNRSEPEDESSSGEEANANSLVGLKDETDVETILADVIRRVVEAAPESLAVPNRRGDPPMMALVREAGKGIDLDVVLKVVPNAVQFRNERTGEYPLHLAIRLGRRRDEVYNIFATDPTISEEKDADGYLPLHLWLVREEQDKELLDELLIAHEEAASIPLPCGTPPVVVAAASGDLDSIYRLLQCAPGWIRPSDRGERKRKRGSTFLI